MHVEQPVTASTNFAADLLSKDEGKLTPLMRQYLELKKQYPDCFLFFRLGDFYELFFNDAVVASKELEITLTSRNKNDANPTPMCGVPFHSATNYINRLVANGHRVAICEQMEEAGEAKLVRRDVVRIVSPGTQLDPDALNSKSSNFTLAVHLNSKQNVCWALCDFTTGLFYFGISENIEKWIQLTQSQQIAEVIVPEITDSDNLFNAFKNVHPRTFIHHVPVFYFKEEYATQRICEQFETTKTQSVHTRLDSTTASNCIGPVGALIKYFQESQKINKIYSVNRLIEWNDDGRFEVDPTTVKTLELLPSNHNGRDLSLLSLIDRTKTAMGGRLLKDWVLRPLKNIEQINERMCAVESLRNPMVFKPIQLKCNEIYDLERLCSRISMMMANARDLRALANSILIANDLISILPNHELSSELKSKCNSELLNLCQIILSAVQESPPALVREGGLFNKGFNSDLDELIELTTNGEQWLADFESKERKNTSISSLKVRFNRVYGYYIEVTKSNLSNVPTHYIRKQSMVGGERYITDELKVFEDKILTSEKKRSELEFSIFKDFCNQFSKLAKEVSSLSQVIAKIDCLTGFAELSNEDYFNKPLIDDSLDIEIINGRHPTVHLTTKNFIANSVFMKPNSNFMLITGPNMGGKSTVMRQVALITLLAQIGSYVPADSAKIGIVDKIFTRIGANDNITEGSSTFMVEMTEISYILRSATKRSLVLIDEIGRGTSTFDGLSLAWSLAVEMAENIKSRTMFSTHYHELTELPKYYPTIHNFRMSVKVEKEIVRFLYKLEEGAAERSYGILVAKLAGLPENVLNHASRILRQLETQSRSRKSKSDFSSSEQTGFDFKIGFEDA